MGVDYAVLYPTPPEDKLGVQGRMALLKKREQAQSLIERLRQSGDERPLDQIKLKSALIRDGKREVYEVTLAEMVEQASEIDTVIRDAGPNAKYRYGYVVYPIPKKAEEWLMTLLPADIRSTAGVLMQQMVRDLRYDGGQISSMRARNADAVRQGAAPFFESNIALEKKWPGGFTLTSDQALQVVIGLGSLQPTHLTMVSLLFGLIVHDVSNEELAAAFNDQAVRVKLLTATRLPEPPPEAYDLANLLNTVRIAGLLDTTLHVDA